MGGAQPLPLGVSSGTAGLAGPARAGVVLTATSTAPRWESPAVSPSPTNWGMEPPPVSPQGIGTLARVGLPGERGHLSVGLLDPPRDGWNLQSELRTHLLLSETHSPDFPSDLLYDTGWPSGPLFASLCNGRVASFRDDEDIIRVMRYQT